MNKKFCGFLFPILCLVCSVSAKNLPSSPMPSPILIELFTSEGCSSCPPAEQLLNSWGMALFQAHQALPLAFHVDYWDNSQWKDPFAIPQAASRQQAYTVFYNSPSLFTPQMTVDGQLGFNGADLSQAQYEFSQAASLSALAPMKLTLSLDSGSLQVHVFLPPNTQFLGDPALHVAIFENDLSSHITGGENRGLLLKENFVVRYEASVLRSSVVPLSVWSPRIPLKTSWKLSHLGVAVWLQDLRTMRSQGLNWIYPVSSLKARSIP